MPRSSFFVSLHAFLNNFLQRNSHRKEKPILLYIYIKISEKGTKINNSCELHHYGWFTRSREFCTVHNFIGYAHRYVSSRYSRLHNVGGRLHVGVSHVFCLTVPIVRRYLAKEIKGGRGKEKEKQAERGEGKKREKDSTMLGRRKRSVRGVLPTGDGGGAGRWWLEKVIHLGQRASSALFHRECGSFRWTSPRNANAFRYRDSFFF